MTWIINVPQNEIVSVRKPAASLIGAMLFLMVALLCNVRSVAQVATADVVGTVVDSAGASVPNAKVTVTNQATGVASAAVSDGAGEIVVSQLPAGRYNVTITANGFNAWALKNLDLAGGDRHRITPTLAVGDVQQVVTVTADQQSLQTDTSDVSTSVNETQTQNLPLNGRNLIQLAMFTPGATDYTGGSFSPSPDDERRGSGVSVSGRTGAEDNYLIDGQDDNERFVDTQIAKPSEDGVSELRVVANSPSAELGRAPGATIIYITKSGTNAVHGSAFEFVRNQVLDAFVPNTAPGAAKPTHTQNNYGGSIGGPIRRDKLFYFGDFETYAYTQGVATVSTVPTAAERTGNFAGIAKIFDPNTQTTVNGVTTRQEYPNDQITPGEINPVAQTIINLYPVQNLPGQSNNYSFVSNQVQTDRVVDTRVDYKVSAKNALFFRYNWGKANTTLPYALPASNGFYPGGGTGFGGDGTTALSTDSAGIIDTITLSSKNLLILRTGYNRYDNLWLPQDYGDNQASRLGIPGATTDAMSSGFPQITISGFTSMGSGAFYPTINVQDHYTYGGALQMLRGKHLIKLGGDFVRRQVSDYQSQAPMINFSFSSGFTENLQTSAGGNAMASFLLGYPGGTSRQRYLIRPGYRFLENGWYVQDDYRATHFLTLNAGVRYDYFSPDSEEHNRISDFDYANSVILVAGQGGVSNNAGVHKDFGDIGPRVGFALQLGPKTNIFGGFGIPYTASMQGTPAAMRNAPFVSNYLIAPNLITPINSINNTIPPLVPDSITNPIGTYYAINLHIRSPYFEQYNLTVQRELPYSVVLSAAYVADLGKRQTGSNTSLSLNSASPGAAAIQTRRPLYSLYPNLGAVATVMNYYTAPYHSLQVTLKKNYSNGMTFNVNYTWSHAIDSMESRNYVTNFFTTIKGSSSSDVRNRVSILWVYNLPSKKFGPSWINSITRDWTFTTIGTAESGLPFQVTQTGSQTNGANGTNRPNQVSDFHVSNPSAQEWFNPAAFVAQPNYTWGSEGRNLLTAPGHWDVDLGLHRDVKIKERVTAEFRAEAFDFTNTRYPNAPISVLGQAGFGTITTFTNSRSVQLSVKALF